MRVALTFDAEHPSRPQCPPGAADRIVALLAEQGVLATFFLQGRWATAYPELARTIARSGHLLGNHSHSHARMSNLSDAGLRHDIEEAGAAIRRIAGVDPRPWFRCPFGAGSDNPRVLGALAALGYRNVHWNVDARDWDDEQSAANVEATIVDQTLVRGDGAIVLLHSWPAPTVAALPAIIERLRLGGAHFVTVSALHDGGGAS